MSKIKAIILAGGKGTRMKSELPKVLHKVYDRTIIDYVCDACSQADVDEIYTIVGHKYEMVEESLRDRKNVKCVLQKEQLGTGHAALQANSYIEDDDMVVIVNGDMPLISPYTIKSFISFLELGNYDGALASAVFDKTPAYGRIIRDDLGNLLKIVEQKDCDEEELKVEEVNIGLYCFKGKYLKEAFGKLDNNNAQNEYYITDIPYHIIARGGRIGVYMIQDSDETQGINSRSDLSIVTKTLFNNTREKHMDAGVTLIDPNNTYISLDAKIGRDTIIYPGTHIQGTTIIGENCSIGPNSIIIDSTIGNNVTIESSKVNESIIKDNSVIGPFANLRVETIVGNSVRLGSFVETKKSTIGDGTKLPHLSYIGDSEIGKKVEVACGVITCNMNVNYKKNKTIVKDGAFIGAGATLLAPITIEEDAIVAAGTTIGKDLSKGSLGVSRAELKIKENFKNNN